ncbi:MAG: TRAP transporter substrate-binding protein DctP [Actinomycetaceae bacterium]|nr:TRAP transporter substrate-binding protein DctP [Actinomycetaceae bacterium]
MKTRIAVAGLTVGAAIALSACSGTTSGTGTAPEHDLILATITVDTTPQAAAIKWFFEEVNERTDGRINIDMTSPQEVCKATETAECVRDGRADIGVALTDYTAQLFPAEVIVSIPFLSNSSQQATMNALWQAYKEHEGVQAKWEQVGLIPVGHWPAGRLTIGANHEINNVADMQGDKWRVLGPYLVEAFESINGNPVSLPGAETYEGVQRGVADSISWAIDGAVDYNLAELLSEWADPGVGQYNTFGMWLNPDTYERFSDEDKKIWDEVVEEFNSGKGMEVFAEGAAHQCDYMLEHQNVNSFVRWDDSAAKEWEEKIGDSLEKQWISEAERNGLEDAEGYLELYKKYVNDVTAEELEKDPVIACVNRFEAEGRN